MDRSSTWKFMKVCHVIVEREGDWYVARALEDSGVFTQGRSFDEIVANIREVADLLHGQKDVQIKLVVPPQIGSPSVSGRRRTSDAARGAVPPVTSTTRLFRPGSTELVAAETQTQGSARRDPASLEPISASRT